MRWTGDNQGMGRTECDICGKIYRDSQVIPQDGLMVCLARCYDKPKKQRALQGLRLTREQEHFECDRCGRTVYQSDLVLQDGLWVCRRRCVDDE